MKLNQCGKRSQTAWVHLEPTEISRVFAKLETSTLEQALAFEAEATGKLHAGAAHELSDFVNGWLSATDRIIDQFPGLSQALVYELSVEAEDTLTFLIGSRQTRGSQSAFNSLFFLEVMRTSDGWKGYFEPLRFGEDTLRLLFENYRSDTQI